VASSVFSAVAFTLEPQCYVPPRAYAVDDSGRNRFSSGNPNAAL
jgi:hypothetical protein